MHPYLIACLINNNCHISLRSNLLMKHASEFPGPLCSFSEKTQRAVLFFGKTTARCAFSDRRLSFIFNSALDFIMRSISIQHRFSAM